MNTRTTALLIAVATGLIIAGVILFVAMRHKGAQPTRDESSIDAEISEIVPRAGDGTVFGPGDRGQLIGVEDGREVYAFEWDRIEPLPRGLWNLTDPSAEIYLEDGSTLAVRSPKGRVEMATADPLGDARAGDTRQPPRNGVLSGGVLIELYPPGVDASAIGGPEPLVRMRTESLEFDTILNELETAHPIHVSTTDLEVTGTGLTVRFSEVRQRLEYLKIHTDGTARYSPARDGAGGESRAPSDRRASAPMRATEPSASAARDRSVEPQTSSSPGQPAPRAAAAAPTPASAVPAKIDLYQAIALGDVVVEQPVFGRRLTSDRLDVWMRLVDNGLPAGAIAPVRLVQAARRTEDRWAPPVPGRVDQTLLAMLLAAQVDGGAPVPEGADTTTSVGLGIDSLTRSGDDDVLMTWSGPLIIAPLAETPETLRDDDATVRFTALAGSVVTLSDRESGAAGTCAWLQYGATSRHALLASRSDDPAFATVESVTASAPDSGRMLVDSLAANLGTGLITVPGAGRVEAIDSRSGEAKLREIRWYDQADFEMFMESGALTSQIRSANVFGRAIATDGNATLEGEVIDTLFAMGEDGRSRLARLLASGSVRTDGGARPNNPDRRVGTLDSARMEILFDDTTMRRDPEPVLVTAWGDVVGERPGEWLEAGFLQVGLVRDDRDNLVTSDVLARSAVRAGLKNGTEIGADELRADTRTQLADLVGHASIRRLGGRIGGAQMRIDGSTSELFVHGAGRLDYSGEDELGLPVRVWATWTESMLFNDAAGLADCYGNVNAASVASRQEEDLRAARVELRFDGADPDAGADPAERSLTRAEVFGASLEDPTAAPAFVESRRFALDASATDGRRLEQFVRLSGPLIVADQTALTLEVPGEGTATVYDTRPGAERSPDEAPTSDVRGATRFDWASSMRMDQRTGDVFLREEVVMIHRPMEPSDPSLFMESETLHVRLTPVRDGERSRSDTNLIEATARDAVYVRSDRDGERGRRELIADTVRYDASTGIAYAEANPGNRISVFDSEQGVPMDASELEWDLARDRVRVTGTAPVSIPR